MQEIKVLDEDRVVNVILLQADPGYPGERVVKQLLLLLF